MPDLRKKRILVVDDDEAVLRSIGSYLSRLGFTVDTAVTGKEALKKAKDHYFNLAILDIKLPDMEGTSLLAKMQETQPRMMRIMLTGYPGFDNAVDSLNRGADAYLVKPVDMEKLKTVIEEKLKEQEESEAMDEDKIVEFIKTRGQKAEDSLKEP